MRAILLLLFHGFLLIPLVFSQHHTNSGLAYNPKLTVEADLVKAVEDRIADYGKLLGIIVDKNQDPKTRNKAIELAKQFFFPNAKIQVSSVNYPGKIWTHDFDDYLIRLRDLPQYQSVTIKFDSQKIEKIEHLGGNHYAFNFTVKQSFYGEGTKVIYSDITIKRIEIDVVETVDNINIPYVKIKFKDIKVIETKRRP